MKSHQTIKYQLLKDAQVKKAYKRLKPEFDLVQMVIERRLAQGITQAELAKKLGTKQSAISRLECGSYNPSVAFLHRLAKALNTELNISFS